MRLIRLITAVLLLVPAVGVRAQDTDFTALPEMKPLPYHYPGLIVDLGVGLWAQPLPMDYDGDGDNDLVVATADVPSNGIYFFENTNGSMVHPVFRPGVRIGPAQHNITVCYADGKRYVLTPGAYYPNFAESSLENPEPISFDLELAFERIRANQWKFADYNGDGALDLVIGVGVWDDYGWDDAFNDEGEWTNGPLHGYVYVALNRGTTDAPEYGELKQVTTGDGPVDVYGAPSPNFADFDGDGDLDLICGSFLDTLTWFENIGTRTEPKYAPGRTLARDGDAIHMELQMLQVVAMDWDKDGDLDLIVGQEDGRVALLDNTGAVENGMPVFTAPRFFRQVAQRLKVGVLPTPVGVDMDGDGDDDLIAGDTAGYLNFVENLGGDAPTPRWASPVRLEAGGETIRIQAGENGGIQGPCEAKWGYTVPSVADWNHDGRLDIMINSIWGEVLWYEFTGTGIAPAQHVRVDWDGPPPKPAWVWWTPEPDQLVTQWRTSPYMGDWNGDGLTDLVMLDHEGYLALFLRKEQAGDYILQPGQRVFTDAEGKPLRLNDGWAGKSGRRKFTFADWDGDGRLDLLINGRNIDFMRNVSQDDGLYRFENEGPIASNRLAGHTTCPAIVDWNEDGIPDLVAGAEDGLLYYLENPRSAQR